MITPFWFTMYFGIGIAFCLLGAGYAAKEENGGKVFGYLIMAGFDVWAAMSMLEIMKRLG
jgi:hypothetical protein